MFNGYCGDFYYKFYTFVSSRFRDTLFAKDHLLIWGKTLFDIMQKSSKFLLEIVTLVSSANIMGTDEVFSVGGRSCI
jgi:hypothetical protein